MSRLPPAYLESRRLRTWLLSGLVLLQALLASSQAAVPSAISGDRTLGTTVTCATKRGDGMDGKSHCLYRQAVSPWGVASGGCKPEVK
jgi:hypothetical protein